MMPKASNFHNPKQAQLGDTANPLFYASGTIRNLHISRAFQSKETHFVHF
jgi:hypothetical protein